MDWTDPDTFERVVQHAQTKAKGNYFEAFEKGDRIEHDPGLSLSQHGNDLWTSQTLNHDPEFWRSDAAARLDHEGPPVHPDYLLAATMGPSVEALSEKGGYFLGRSDIDIVRYPPPGTELRVESTVLRTRASDSRPEYGIVTWETRGIEATSGDVLCSYERTNMVPRQEPLDPGAGDAQPDGEEGEEGTGSGDRDDETRHTDDNGRTGDGQRTDGGDGPNTRTGLPSMHSPSGTCFEDFRVALDRAADDGAAVAYRHERGRTMDDVLISSLPLATLNTAGQHYNAHEMADSPSGAVVAYGDVTRSIVLGHARSDERTYRELGYDDERFHDFVTHGDTVYGFTRVLDADERVGPSGTGLVEFEHIGFDQTQTPVYSGRRRALIERRDGTTPS